MRAWRESFLRSRCRCASLSLLVQWGRGEQRCERKSGGGEGRGRAAEPGSVGPNMCARPASPECLPPTTNRRRAKAAVCSAAQGACQHVLPKGVKATYGDVTIGVPGADAVSTGPFWAARLWLRRGRDVKSCACPSGVLKCCQRRKHDAAAAGRHPPAVCRR